MTTVLINPLDEGPRPAGAAAKRLDTLTGKTLGLLDISKPGGSFFLDRIESVLKDRFGVARIIRATKPTFTKPAPVELLEKLVGDRAEAVVEGLAD